ncbi:MAG: Nramp family divalent metal transporter, partial [Nitrososphaera sp.]|nr:Nramp family divalent metal transporter [Nitrososphaera sp.]
GAYASAAGTALGSFLWPASYPATESFRALSWAAVIVIGSVAIITASRHVYQTIENFMRVICIATVVLILVATLVPSEVHSNYQPFLCGLSPIQLGGCPARQYWPDSWDPKDSPILMSALLFTGMGGFWNLLYSYWVKNKKWGLANSDSDKNPTQVDDSAKNRQNYNTWLRVLHWDVSIGTIGNLLTTSGIALLALTYLHGSAELPSGWRLVVIQSKLFSGLGVWGPWLFITIATLFLIDFWVTTADAVAQVHADALTRFYPKLGQMNPHDLYLWIVTVLAAITFGTMFFATPQTLFLVNGVINAFAMTLVCFCVWRLWKDLRSTSPSWMRPGLIVNSTFACAVAFYLVGFALYLIYSQ